MLGLRLVAAGCVQTAQRDALDVPRELAVVVGVTTGQTASVLVDLRRNPRHDVDIRIAPGMVVYDGRRVWSFEEGPDGVTVEERTSGTTFVFPARGTLLHVAEGTAWIEGADGVVACSLRTRTCEPATTPAPAPVEHAGPGEGFRVVSRDERLWVQLPSEPDDAPGTQITGPVTRVIALTWVHDRLGAVEPVLDRTFRGRGSILMGTLDPVVDGALQDWGAPDVLVVESPWQIESGGESWRGERDGSFSVAAARSTDAICLAGRVRDDELTDGDIVHLTVGRAQLDIPLTGGVPPYAARAQDWFGMSYEGCLRIVPRYLASTSVRFGAAFDDADSDGVTVLSAAPTIAGTPGGQLRLQP